MSDSPGVRESARGRGCTTAVTRSHLSSGSPTTAQSGTTGRAAAGPVNIVGPEREARARGAGLDTLEGREAQA